MRARSAAEKFTSQLPASPDLWPRPRRVSAAAPLAPRAALATLRSSEASSLRSTSRSPDQSGPTLPGARYPIAPQPRTPEAHKSPERRTPPRTGLRRCAYRITRDSASVRPTKRLFGRTSRCSAVPPNGKGARPSTPLALSLPNGSDTEGPSGPVRTPRVLSRRTLRLSFHLAGKGLSSRLRSYRLPSALRRRRSRPA